MKVVTDPAGARDAHGNPFFLWLERGPRRDFLNALELAGVDELHLRDGFDNTRPGMTRERFTAYRNGRCITAEVFA